MNVKYFVFRIKWYIETMHDDRFFMLNNELISKVQQIDVRFINFFYIFLLVITIYNTNVDINVTHYLSFITFYILFYV